MHTGSPTDENLGPPGETILAPANQPRPDGPARAIRLVSLSFGAASNYAAAGGYPIYSDSGSQLDLTTVTDGQCTVAAFIVGAPAIRIRTKWESKDVQPHRIVVRATRDGATRVAEQAIDLIGGNASIELPVIGLSTRSVGMAVEHWLWECLAEGGGFVPATVSGPNWGDGLTLVRVYFTAARPLSA